MRQNFNHRQNEACKCGETLTKTTPTLKKSKLTGAGELRVHIFVDGRHPAEYQRPVLLNHGQDSAWSKGWRLKSPRHTKIISPLFVSREVCILRMYFGCFSIFLHTALPPSVRCSVPRVHLQIYCGSTAGLMHKTSIPFLDVPSWAFVQRLGEKGTKLLANRLS